MSTTVSRCKVISIVFTRVTTNNENNAIKEISVIAIKNVELSHRRHDAATHSLSARYTSIAYSEIILLSLFVVIVVQLM